MNFANSIEIHHLTYKYLKEGPALLSIENLAIAKGERVFLYGPSGSGKTTLLGLISGVLSSQPGQIKTLGRDLGSLTSSERDQLRGVHIGYIFQMFNLLPYLTVRENIMLPIHFQSKRRERGAVVESLAQALDIENILRSDVTQLSVGQQQRVAVARALIGGPELIIADEPTSALDADQRDRFLNTLLTQCKNTDATLLFVSHDRSLAQHFDRSIDLSIINQVGGSR